MDRKRFDKKKYLNLYFDDVSLNETAEKIKEYINTDNPHSIFTLGAELVVRAQKDEFIKDVYNNADLLTVDSNVVFYSAILSGIRFKEPVSAVRLIMHFLKNNSEKGYKYYLLGAKQDVLEQAIENIKKMYPNISIVGYHNGYFDINDDEKIVRQIRELRPDILLVGMSSPLKEKFINKNYKKMSVPVSIGVGGAIDIIAGKAKLAPPWISSLGLEWFYRFIQEPGRLWKRYLTTNLFFVLYVFKNLIWKNK